METENALVSTKKEKNQEDCFFKTDEESLHILQDLRHQLNQNFDRLWVIICKDSTGMYTLQVYNVVCGRLEEERRSLVAKFINEYLEKNKN
jgi:hypothetical protein